MAESKRPSDQAWASVVVTSSAAASLVLLEECLLAVEADLHLGEDERQEVAPEVDQALVLDAVGRDAKPRRSRRRADDRDVLPGGIGRPHRLSGVRLSAPREEMDRRLTTARPVAKPFTGSPEHPAASDREGGDHVEGDQSEPGHRHRLAGRDVVMELGDGIRRQLVDATTELGFVRGVAGGQHHVVHEDRSRRRPGIRARDCRWSARCRWRTSRWWCTDTQGGRLATNWV